MLYSTLGSRSTRADSRSFIESMQIETPKQFRDVLLAPVAPLSPIQQQIVHQMDRYISEHIATGSGGFRGKQLSIFEDAADFFRYGLSHGFVKVPPRVGKTTLMAKIAAATNIPTVIGVPTKFLVGQTIKEFKKFAPHLSIGEYHGEKKEPNKHIVVAVYNSLVPAVERGMFRQSHPMLFEDEGHHALTPARRQLLAAFDFVINWTATERFDAKKAVSTYVEHCIHYMSLQEAIDDGLLSKPSIRLIKTEIDLSSVDWVQGKYDEKEFLRVIKKQKLAEKSAELHRQNHMGEIGLGFCSTVEEARYFAQVYESAGIPSRAVSGYDSTSYIEESIRAHKNGSVHMLFSAQLLTESYDNPRITVVHGFSPSFAPVLIEQSRSRGLTLDPENPNKVTTIYEYFFEDQGNRPPGITLLDILEDTVKYKSGARGNFRPRFEEVQEDVTDTEPEESAALTPEVDVQGLKVIMSEVAARQFLERRRSTYQKMMVFNPRNLLALAREVGVDHDLRKMAAAKFERLKDDSENDRYIDAVGLPRWPATLRTYVSYFGSWNVYRGLALTHAEQGRVSEIDPIDRLRQIHPILRMLDEVSIDTGRELLKYANAEHRSLNQLEEMLLIEIPEMVAGTFRLDDPVITEWLAHYNKDHLHLIAQDILRRVPHPTMDVDDLMLEGFLVLVEEYRKYEELEEKPDRMNLLLKAYDRMSDVLKMDPHGLGLVEIPKYIEGSKDPFELHRELETLREIDGFFGTARTSGARRAEPYLYSTLLDGPDPIDWVELAEARRRLTFRHRDFISMAAEQLESGNRIDVDEIARSFNISSQRVLAIHREIRSFFDRISWTELRESLDDQKLL